jgi:hypothetical protein
LAADKYSNKTNKIETKNTKGNPPKEKASASIEAYALSHLL